jgi:isopentenyldiphosphate isomerase
MNYYKKVLYIPKVDKKDKIIGRVERWDAHEHGVLHRGFTVIVMEKEQVLLQHRKHLVFDNYIDLTASSHQVYVDSVLQTPAEAVFNSLNREWNITKEMFVEKEPKLIGKALYKSFDGTYTEHELCHLYLLNLNDKVPDPSKEFAYGYFKAKLKDILNKDYKGTNGLAPWVVSFYEQGLL